MSHYWCYECKTCGRESEEINHGDEVLRDLARIWPQIRAAFDSTSKRTQEKLEIKIAGYDSVGVFLADHEGHDLWLHDEYGWEHTPLNIPPHNDDILKKGYDMCGLSYDGLLAILRQRGVEESRIGVVMRDALTEISRFIDEAAPQ